MKLIKLANPKGVIKSENGKVMLTPKELDQKIEFQTAVFFCFSFVPSDTADLAALSFVQYFTNNFDDSGISLHVCQLEDAILETCLTNIDARKVLVLYFHNSKDPFAKLFCESLALPEVKKSFNDKFFLLGWDVENQIYRPALIKALNESPIGQSDNQLSELPKLVAKKSCVALLIVPIEDSLAIFSCIRGKTPKKDIVGALNAAAEALKNEKACERLIAGSSGTTSEPDSQQPIEMDSTNYQQLMLDMLGDRDYDSFEYDQLNLLKEKIGYALYGPPQEETGYKKDENEKIKELFEVILQQNNLVSKWKDRVVVSFIHNCTEPLPSEKAKRSKEYPDYNPRTDITPVPIFVLRKCKHSENPCRIFIDDSGRVYRSWAGYLNHNKLPECRMILPKNGRYQADQDGKVLLERHLSPACGVDVKILQGTDIASTAAGIVSTGIFVAAAIPAIAVAPAALVVAGVTGIGVGVYSIGRSVYSLYDRHHHKETLSFANSESRGAYLNIVAGSLGFVGAGANMAVSQLAARGVNITKGATATVNVIQIANISASGISIANSGYDVFDQWLNKNQTPSMLTIIQLSSSILFFGHAVYNFKMAGTIVEEAQANTLKEYQESLRSNRHRKTFSKLVKETVSQNGNDMQKAHSEVIKTIRNIGNKDEVFAALTRSNKAMNKNGIKFSAENGEVKLNGVSVDIAKFSAMEKNEVLTFLSNFSSDSQPREPTSVEVSSMTSKVLTTLKGKMNMNEIVYLSIDLVKVFGDTENSVKEKISSAVVMLVDTLVGSPENYLKALDEIFPNHRSYFHISQMVFGFFQSLIDPVEQQYKKWRETQDPDSKLVYFADLSLDATKRAIQIFEKVTNVYFVATHLTSAGLRELLNYFYTWFAKQTVAYEEHRGALQRRSAHSAPSVPLLKCTKCCGEYYAPNH